MSSNNYYPPPRKHTKYLLSPQVEEHEIGISYEECECPDCGGTGVCDGEDPDGNYYSDDCSNCYGSGILYVQIND
jgi:DnaJ-class molecular chaperone